MLNLLIGVSHSDLCERNVRDRLFAFHDRCAQHEDIPEMINLPTEPPSAHGSIAPHATTPPEGNLVQRPAAPNTQFGASPGDKRQTTSSRAEGGYSRG
jgi:hypothetical protein